MVLFGTTVLIPQYLQVLLGYTAERAGMVLSPAGFVMMIMMAVAGRSLGKVDPRLMVALGYIATAVGIYNLTRLDLNTAFGTVTLWRMLQVIGLPFVFIPISTLNYVGVPHQQDEPDFQPLELRPQPRRQRGTALLTTYIARSSQVHQAALAANVIHRQRPLPPLHGPHDRNMMSHGMSAATASQMAVGRAYQDMLRQASMLSYKNAFFILSVIIICLVPLPFVMRLPPKRQSPTPKPWAATSLLRDSLHHRSAPAQTHRAAPLLPPQTASPDPQSSPASPHHKGQRQHLAIVKPLIIISQADTMSPPLLPPPPQQQPQDLRQPVPQLLLPQVPPFRKVTQGIRLNHRRYCSPPPSDLNFANTFHISPATRLAARPSPCACIAGQSSLIVVSAYFRANA